MIRTGVLHSCNFIPLGDTRIDARLDGVIIISWETYREDTSMGIVAVVYEA